MAIDPKDAFLHVIYDYRCLATAGYAWSAVGAGGTEAAKGNANKLLPEVGTMIQDSIHVHARSLMEFYTLSSSRFPTDVFMHRSFGSLAIDTNLDAYLKSRRRAIEVHSLHLTAWREVSYRANNANAPDDLMRHRPDWNIENRILIDKLVEALKEISQQRTPWQKPFAELHNAVVARLSDGSYDWPANLGKKRDVENYLVGIGL
ncbi:hypothetical protein [Nocardia thraciensis]